jgi:hypothetical protein
LPDRLNAHLHLQRCPDHLIIAAGSAFADEFRSIRRQLEGDETAKRVPRDVSTLDSKVI